WLLRRGGAVALLVVGSECHNSTHAASSFLENRYLLTENLLVRDIIPQPKGRVEVPAVASVDQQLYTSGREKRASSEAARMIHSLIINSRFLSKPRAFLTRIVPLHVDTIE
ncbi:unnamed protein product, partial [Ectocarpus sp. 12 AP-2014]